MLSFNQQGATDTSYGTSNALAQQWATQSRWDEKSNQNLSETFVGDINHGYENCSQQTIIQASEPVWFNEYGTPQRYQCYQSTLPSQSDLNQINHVPVMQPMVSSHSSNQNANFLKHGTPVRSHHARISLIPNASGGFKAIVKRKRKRTMFTTEQVAALELVFRKKPYVTREDRQVIVQQLQLSDTSVKVWFQNRRLREKKAAEEAAEEALYAEQSQSEQSFYSCADSGYQECAESNSSSNTSHLDVLESELSQRVDESGYVTLDEKSIGAIVTAIDSVLSTDVDLDFNTPSNSSEDIQSPSKPACETLELDDSEDGSTYASSMYEPISPADSPTQSGNDEQPAGWKPFPPEQSLQKLFDLHFC